MAEADTSGGGVNVVSSTTSDNEPDNTVRGRGKNARWTCSICGAILTTKFNFNRHVLTHDPTRTITCDICGVVLRGNIKQHMRSHRPPTFRCPGCPLKFRHNYQLQEHVSIHDNAKPYDCPYCDYDCRAITFLKRHMKKHHPHH